MSPNNLLEDPKRQRHQTLLLKKFIKSGFESLNDREVRELLLGQQQLQHDFEERRKEQRCLYGVINISRRPSITLDKLCQGVVNLLPQGWQYPEIACAKFIINDKECTTENYKETEWKQSSDIRAYGAKIGTVEVGYLEARPESDEGPFLKEERLLINAVAEQLGEVTGLKQEGGSQRINSQATPGGHVTPLQEKFIKSGLESLNDQEIIELLLSQSHPYRECRKLAKECIKLFGNLRGLLSASPQKLREAGISAKGVFSIKLLQEMPREVLKQRIIEKFVYHSSKEFFDYLCYSMRDLKKEVFKVIYLNNRNQIIDTVDLFEGTLDSIPIRPREIVESAIKHDTTRLIFAHNHPSGDPTPSKSDKQLTRDLVFMGMILDIKVLDHIIIGDSKYFSFANEGLIEKYEDGFLNMKIKAVFDIGADILEKPTRVSALHRN